MIHIHGSLSSKLMVSLSSLLVTVSSGNNHIKRKLPRNKPKFSIHKLIPTSPMGGAKPSNKKITNGSKNTGTPEPPRHQPNKIENGNKNTVTPEPKPVPVPEPPTPTPSPNKNTSPWLRKKMKKKNIRKAGRGTGRKNNTYPPMLVPTPTQ